MVRRKTTKQQTKTIKQRNNKKLSTRKKTRITYDLDGNPECLPEDHPPVETRIVPYVPPEPERKQSEQETRIVPYREPEIDSYTSPEMFYATNAERRMMPFERPQWTQFDQQRWNSFNKPQEEDILPSPKKSIGSVASNGFSKGSSFYNTLKNNVSQRIPRSKPKIKQNDDRTTKIIYNGDIIEVPISMIPKKKSWLEKNGKKIINATIAAGILGPASYGTYKAVTKANEIKNWLKDKFNKKPDEEK